MEGFIIIAALIFGLYQFRSVKKFEKKLNRERMKNGQQLDKFI